MISYPFCEGYSRDAHRRSQAGRTASASASDKAKVGNSSCIAQKYALDSND
jgi:hypothetical protein